MDREEWEKRVISGVIVYCHTSSPRLHYVLQFLSRYFSIGVSSTSNVSAFLSYSGIKVNYSSAPVRDDEFWISPYGLLFAKGIEEVHPECFDHAEGYKAFFKKEGNMGFDLFSALFFLLSRYEEYRPHQKDEYGRYAHSNSLAFKNGFLQLPLINIWLNHFGLILQKKFGEAKLTLPLSDFSFLPTYDIDIAWSFQHKGVIRNGGGLVQSLRQGKWSLAKHRLKVLLRKEPDPYDSYEWMDTLHRRYQVKPIYFFHVGLKKNKYDKNISPLNAAFTKLVARTASAYVVGLHPSWQSGDEPLLLEKEKTVLENIIQQKVSFSRQHYIRFTLPQTYRQLMAAGITNEYSMGYGSINGFRASVATPFYWYDLEKEEATALLIHPFCFMEATSFFEQKQGPGQALQELMHYYKVVRENGGQLITIWHNNFLGTDPLFSGWRDVYEEFVRYLSLQKA